MSEQRFPRGWKPEAVAPRVDAFTGRERCQSRSVRGHWKGHPCGNLATYRVGRELCCHVHIGQALERNEGAIPCPLEGAS